MRRWLLLALILFWVAAVIASHTPQDRLPELPANGKVLHVVGFFGLATILSLVLATYGKTGWRQDVLVLLVMTAYAALDEGTQPFFHRNGCVADVILDASASMLALMTWCFASWVLRALIRRRKRWQEVQRKIQRYFDSDAMLPLGGNSGAMPSREPGSSLSQ